MANIVVQHVKLPLAIPEVHIRALAHVLASPVPIQLQANMPEKAANVSPGAWAPAIHRRDRDGVPIFCFQPGLTIDDREIKHQ